MFYFYYFNGRKDMLLGTLYSDYISTTLDYLERFDFDLTLFKIIPVNEYPIYFSQITQFEEIINKLEKIKIEATIME